MLNAKAKEDFENYAIERLKKVADLPDKTLLDGLYSTELTFQLAYAIDWFDSVGIFIYIDSITSQDWRGWRFHIDYESKVIKPEEYFENRISATKEVVIKANEIYNTRS